MTIFSKKNETGGALNNSKAVVTITDIYRKDEGPNCSKPNYNALVIEVDGFDVVPCKDTSNICNVNIKFDDGPVQSFTPFYLKSMNKTDNSNYIINSPALVRQFETHRSVIIEISTVEDTTQYEFNLISFNQPLVVNTNK